MGCVSVSLRLEDMPDHMHIHTMWQRHGKTFGVGRIIHRLELERNEENNTLPELFAAVVDLLAEQAMKGPPKV